MRFEGILVGGLLVAVALDALAETLIEKSNFNCHLGSFTIYNLAKDRGL